VEYLVVQHLLPAVDFVALVVDYFVADVRSVVVAAAAVVECFADPSVDCAAPVVSAVRHTVASSGLDGSELGLEPVEREWLGAVDIVHLAADSEEVVRDTVVVVVVADIEAVAADIEVVAGNVVAESHSDDNCSGGFHLDVELDNDRWDLVGSNHQACSGAQADDLRQSSV